MQLTVETAQEEDGRWIGEVVELPGALAYGQTREEAIARVQSKPRAVLTVLRNGELRQVVLNFAREHQRE